MQMQTDFIETIEMHKADILGSIFQDSPDISIGDLNDLLLTRQALLFHFLQMNQIHYDSFVRFCKKNSCVNFYDTNTKIDVKKKLRASVLEQFGMNDLVPKLESLGYTVV